jgi:hypothetical protein
LAVVFAVSVVIEWLRYLLYSSEYAAHPDLWWIVACAVLVNLGIHRWLLPETLPKLVTSAAFTEAGLPPVASLLYNFVLTAVKELIVPPRRPH